MGSTKYIQNVEGDPVLKVSCQKPSTSHEGPLILDTLEIKLSAQNFQGSFLWVKQGQTRSHMTSRTTLSSMSPIRNPKHPPNAPMKLSGYLPFGKTRDIYSSKLMPNIDGKVAFREDNKTGGDILTYLAFCSKKIAQTVQKLTINSYKA